MESAAAADGTICRGSGDGLGLPPSQTQTHTHTYNQTEEGKKETSAQKKLVQLMTPNDDDKY